MVRFSDRKSSFLFAKGKMNGMFFDRSLKYSLAEAKMQKYPVHLLKQVS